MESVAPIIESIISLLLRVLTIVFLFGLVAYGVFALIWRVFYPGI